MGVCICGVRIARALTKNIFNLMYTKSIFFSKYFWLGCAQIIYGIAGFALHKIDGASAYGFVTTGVATISLRFKTSMPVSLSGGVK